ncbi:MAG: ABC transporter permease, partial [Bacilli bacterium]|nr:ABC transporter permease [Bacilli bacterium]
KWFLIANLIFLILIIGVANIDTVIKFFGGDFNEKGEVLVIDNVGVYDTFKDNFIKANSYISDYNEIDITLYDKDYEEAKKELEEDNNKILVIIDNDYDNYLKAKVVSKEKLGTITNSAISNTLKTIRSEMVLSEYEITKEEFLNIEKNVEVESEVLSDSNIEDNLIVATVMQVVTLPIFMLIMFLIQMIGAEINEEKSTRSMEIIISNVSPKAHFLSKVIASNLFVLFQSFLLVCYAFVAVIIRFIITRGDVIGTLDGDILEAASSLPLEQVLSTLSVMIPILIVMMVLTFIAYSLLAGVLASMTTNLEDFEQLQTPIVIISLVGYYLSLAAGVFKGSLFIKIMSYIPLVSSLLSPTLYVMGEITIFDLLGSILLLLGLIYLLIKYGMRIYKVGILNYSGVGLWKKMAKAMKEG